MINIRYILLIGIIAISYITTIAQTRPKWIEQTPKQNNDYYYRVGIGKAQTQEDAEKKATANIVYDSALAIGIAIDVSQLDSIVKKSSLATVSKYYIIPINIVCRHYEYKMDRDGKYYHYAYVLAQVAKRLTPEPVFTTFDCLEQKEIE